MYNTNSKGLKVIWMLVILLMTGLGVFLLSKQTAEFMEARIVTNIETSTASLKINLKHLFTYLFTVPSLFREIEKNRSSNLFPLDNKM